MHSDSDLAILGKAQMLADTLTMEDIAGLQLPKENVHKKRKSGERMPKRKGSGGPPPEYTAVELLLDLRTELGRTTPDVERVIPLYLKLNAMVNR